VNWQLVWLAVIAISVAVLAAIQIAVLLRLARLAQQTSAAIDEIRYELRPLMAKVNRIADDAARATALALAQVERVDYLLATTADRVDEAVSAVRQVMVAPLRSGSVLIGVLRAVVGLFGEWRQSARHAREDEDAMFVG
jgi:hypothetical protein